VRAGLASRLCQGMWSCAVPARDSEADRDTSPGRAHQRPASRRQPGKARPNHQGDHHTPVPQERHHDGAAQRDCLLLETRRAGVPRRPRAGPAAPVRRLARLLFRQAGRLAQRAGRWSKLHGPRPHTAIEHTERPQGTKPWGRRSSRRPGPCVTRTETRQYEHLQRRALMKARPQIFGRDKVTHATERLSRCVIIAGCGSRAISASIGTPLTAAPAAADGIPSRMFCLPSAVWRSASCRVHR